MLRCSVKKTNGINKDGMFLLNSVDVPLSLVLYEHRNKDLARVCESLQLVTVVACGNQDWRGRMWGRGGSPTCCYDG